MPSRKKRWVINITAAIPINHFMAMPHSLWGALREALRGAQGCSGTRENQTARGFYSPLLPPTGPSQHSRDSGMGHFLGVPERRIARPVYGVHVGSTLQQEQDGLRAAFGGGAQRWHTSTIDQIGDQGCDKDRLAGPAKSGDTKAHDGFKQRLADSVECGLDAARQTVRAGQCYENVDKKTYIKFDCPY